MPREILFVMDVPTGGVRVAVTAPAEADSSRPMEYDKNQLQTACRCRLMLPQHTT